MQTPTSGGGMRQDLKQDKQRSQRIWLEGSSVNIGRMQTRCCNSVLQLGCNECVKLYRRANATPPPQPWPTNVQLALMPIEGRNGTRLGARC